MVDTGLPMIGSGICRLHNNPTQYPTATRPRDPLDKWSINLAPQPVNLICYRQTWERHLTALHKRVSLGRAGFPCEPGIG